MINKMCTSRSRTCNQTAKIILGFVPDQLYPWSRKYGCSQGVRKSYRDSEWTLNPKLFKGACSFCRFLPHLDCFATKNNTQLPKYISYQPDPFATYLDPLEILYFLPIYTHKPDFSKIQTDKADPAESFSRGFSL